jgi:hypothetical protein
VSTLEILIASALYMLGITAAVLVVFGTEAMVTDAQVTTKALVQANTLLERARASKQNFSNITSTSTMWLSERTYLQTLRVLDYTPCQKKVTGEVSWKNMYTQNIELPTIFTDSRKALSLGGDCGLGTVVGSWVAPKKFAEGSLSLGDPIAIDELNGLLYGGSTEFPYFFVVDTKTLVPGRNAAMFTSFANGFSMPAPVVAVDAVVWRGSSGETRQYVYVALDATSSQMAVIDVTDPYNPVQVATRTLNNIVSNGSEPGGHKLYYYDDRLYVLTRYTAGPEMHTFDVSVPSNPIELGGGVELGVTVNGFAVEERFTDVRRRFAYMATSQRTGELKVYNITDPASVGAAVEVPAARQDLPGAQNGLSVYPLGNRLYFGRASTPAGPDVYIFDSTDPLVGLPIVAAQNIDAGVSSLIVVGPLMFVATPKSKKEIQIWNVSDVTVSLVSTYTLGSAVFGGFDYAAGVLYATGQGSSSVEVLTGQ